MADKEIQFTEEDAREAQTMALALVDIDRKARGQGSSLVEIIVQAARNQFGIDVRPSPREGEPLLDAPEPAPAA